MIFGYARISTKKQSLDMQLDELERYSCEEVITEKESGAKKDRKELQMLLNKLRKDDTLVVYKLDRLGRNMHQLVNLLQEFNEKGIHFVSIKDGIDTSTTIGRFLLHIFGAMAEMDRECNKDFINKLRALGHSVEDDTDDVGRTANAIVGNQVRNINDRPNDVGFAWHLNASNGEGHGVEVLCYSAKEAPMAARISAEIAKRTGWKDRGAKIRPDIGVIRSSNCPFFLIETGFIDNDSDMAKWNVDAITSVVIFA